MSAESLAGVAVPRTCSPPESLVNEPRAEAHGAPNIEARLCARCMGAARSLITAPVESRRSRPAAARSRALVFF